MLSYEPNNCKTRWLGYFDLLGTSELIRAGKATTVFLAYQDALKELGEWQGRHAEVNHAWFSDTFILFTEDDSIESFGAIERVCRWFVSSLLLRQIPVRGSMSCGKLYVDHSNSIYLGRALLEAYEWGECQDWIGFLLCPSSITKLTDLKLPVSERLHYVQCEIPLKNKEASPGMRACSWIWARLHRWIKNKKASPNMRACVLGNWLPKNRQEVLLANFEQMKAGQSDHRVRKKYDRTIEFILKHKRKPIGNR